MDGKAEEATQLSRRQQGVECGAQLIKRWRWQSSFWLGYLQSRVGIPALGLRNNFATDPHLWAEGSGSGWKQSEK